MKLFEGSLYVRVPFQQHPGWLTFICKSINKTGGEFTNRLAWCQMIAKLGNLASEKMQRLHFEFGWKFRMKKGLEGSYIYLNDYFLVSLRWDTFLGWYTKGQVERSVWMWYIYWCSIVTIQNIQNICERERSGGSACNSERVYPNLG